MTSSCNEVRENCGDVWGKARIARMSQVIAAKAEATRKRERGQFVRNVRAAAQCTAAASPHGGIAATAGTPPPAPAFSPAQATAAATAAGIADGAVL